MHEDDRAGADLGPSAAASPRRPGMGRRGRRLLAYAAVAALAASAGVSTTIAVRQAVIPRHAALVAALDDDQVYGKVEPGVVDISSNLRYREETAEGTGIVIDAASGLVLTNNHVINGATSVTVTPVLTGRGYRAEILGYDPADDVALLRVRGVPGLKAVTVPKTSPGEVAVGTPVLAIGNEGGQGGSPTVAPGVISSLDRTIEASDQSSGVTETLHGMLQTTADIRPGDSGGPLADAAGRVIGIDTAAGGSAPAAHAGYAIPIRAALAIARQILAGRPGPAVHIGLPAFLGVVVADRTRSDPAHEASQQQHRTGVLSSSSHGCVFGDEDHYSAVPGSIAPAGSGALVDGVLCGSAADAAGLSAGDVITAFGGRTVTSPGSLTAVLGRLRPGSLAPVAWVSPDGSSHTALITLSAGPAG